MRCMVALGGMVMITFGLKITGPIRDPDSCEVSRETGCIHGTVTDESRQPIRGVMVELFPAGSTGDERWRSRKSEWTDRLGRYRFDRIEPGEYLVATHYYGAPDGRHPFVPSFFPGVGAENHAQRIAIRPRERQSLIPLRLRPLSLANIRVEVVWSDGSRPEWSSLLFHNRSYPNQAAIGDEAPGVEDGRGTFLLPLGFDYEAVAQVNCDAGTRIESRESQPVRQVIASKGVAPRELVFTLPGSPCKLWRPN